MGWIRGLHGILLARCTAPNVLVENDNVKICYGKNIVEIWAYDPDDSVFDEAPTAVVGLMVYFDNPYMVERLLRLLEEYAGNLYDSNVEAPVEAAFEVIGERDPRPWHDRIQGPGMALIVGDDYTIFDIVSRSVLGDSLDNIADIIKNAIENNSIDTLVGISYNYPNIPDLVISHGYCTNIIDEMKRIEEALRYGECENLDMTRDECEYQHLEYSRNYQTCIVEKAYELERKGVLAPEPEDIVAIINNRVYVGREAFEQVKWWLPARDSASLRKRLNIPN